MGRVRIAIALSAPTLLERIWYRRINDDPPLSVASTGPGSSSLARLVPYRFRRFHHAYATMFGFYWLPCPLCGREYGGHEAGKSIPDPIAGPPMYVMICSRCSRSQARPHYPRDAT